MRFLIVKKWILTLGLLVLAVTAKADTGFLKTLPAEDFAAAGLQKLTPEELTRLEALVQRYNKGEMTEVRQQAEAKVSAARAEAVKRDVASEKKARNSEAKANETGAKAEAVPAKKRRISAAGRKRIIEATKKRWAAYRAQKAAAGRA